MIDSESNVDSALARMDERVADKPATSVQVAAIVRAIDMTKQKITLYHEPIAEWSWPAMTMGFAVDNEELLVGCGGAGHRCHDRRTGRWNLRHHCRYAEGRAMIAGLIRWSIHNRFLVLLATGFLVAWGLYSISQTPVDALPDLSDVQVIIKTSYPGQAPQVVDDQVTYPLTTAMLAVPKAVTVRGYSFFGDSFVYIIFEDGTDLYWARSRVLEYLSQVAGQLPEGATPALGPDATGVGWVYEYALVDRTGQHDLSELRSIQDWFLKFELQTVPGVAEVATIGGMVKQYQVVLDPDKLRAFDLTLAQVKSAIRAGNQETGGSVIEMGEAEYMVRASGLPAKVLTTWPQFPSVSTRKARQYCSRT